MTKKIVLSFKNYNLFSICIW